MALLKEKMLKVHMFITFGVTDPHQRQQYLSQYGCCKWTPRAVQLIKDLTLPLLEIGAGAGLWQKELSNNGIDIKAYDDRSNESLPGNGKYSKRRRSNVAVIIVRIVFISSFLFYCLLSNHSFQTNPNRITNCFKLLSLFTTYNYIAPASLF